MTPRKKKLLSIAFPELVFEDPNTFVTELRGEKGSSGKDGKDAKDYILTETDKQDIADLIDVPIVEKTIEKITEKTKVIHETPIVKEVAIKDSPKETAKKLNTLTEAIDQKVIKGLTTDLNTLKNGLAKDITEVKGKIDQRWHGGGLSKVSTDATLTGIGTPSSPLSVATPSVISSVNNSDGTLTISPTVGAVVASLNLGHANTWTAQQTFNTTAPIFGTMTLGSVLFAGASGLLSQNNSKLFWDNTNFRLGIGTTSPQIPLDVSGSFRVGGVLTGTFPATGEGFEVAYGSASTGLDGVSIGLSIFQSFSRDASAWKDIWMRGREISFDVNGNQRMYLSNSANSFYLNGGVAAMILNSTGAGFGVTPSSPLDAQGLPSVDGNSRSVSRLVDTTAMAIDVGADLSFWGRFSSGGSIGNFASIGGRKENATDGNYASYLNFTTRVFGGSPTERMRITSVGDVGINTTSPSARLHLIKTTEQLRVGYDTSNYFKTTVSSTGLATMEAVGTDNQFDFKTTHTTTHYGLTYTNGGAVTFGVMPRDEFNITEITLGNSTDPWVRMWGASVGTTMTRLDLYADNIFCNGSLFPQGDVLIPRSGSGASSAATQHDSYTMGFQADVWTGSAETFSSAIILNRASTITNNVTFLSVRLQDLTGTQIERLAIENDNGNIGAGVALPTAGLHLRAGTATANTGAPLKFTSGTNLTTAEAGSMEYNGTNLFFTRTGTTRENVFVGNDAASAPTTAAAGAVTNRYGGATNFLGDPNSWASVVIGGTTYKVPLYT